jgi:hypothetical protein
MEKEFVKSYLRGLRRKKGKKRVVGYWRNKKEK